MKRLKGQASLEFVIVLGIVLMLTTMIFLDIGSESTDSFILVGVKNAALSEISKKVLTNSSCSTTSLRSISFSGKKITLNISGCTLLPEDITDSVESKICKTVPYEKDYVNCGAVKYLVEINMV